MKPKDLSFAASAERYQLQLRQVSFESRQQPLWDRSGAGRKFALRAVLREHPLTGSARAANTTRH